MLEEQVSEIVICMASANEGRFITLFCKVKSTQSAVSKKSLKSSSAVKSNRSLTALTVTATSVMATSHISCVAVLIMPKVMALSFLW